MKFIKYLILVLLIAGCSSTPQYPKQTLSQIGYKVNMAMESAKFYHKSGKINESNWHKINEKYESFRFQLLKEIPPSLTYTLIGSQKLQDLANKVLKEIKPYAPLDYNPNIILDR